MSHSQTSAQTRTLCELALESSGLFGDLSEAEISVVARFFERCRYRAGQSILVEGEEDARLLIVGEGEVEVRKRASDEPDAARVATLGMGATLGELKLLDRPGAAAPSSASVLALGEVTVYALPLAMLESEPALRFARSSARFAAARIAADRLRNATVKAADALRAELELSRRRERAARFIVILFSFTCAYVLLVSALQLLPVERRPPAILLTPALGLLLGGPVFVLMRRSPEPRERFGLTWRDWPRSTVLAAVATIPMCLFVVFLKWAWINWDPARAGEPLFNPAVGFDPGKFSYGMWALAALAYTATCPLQEFTTRSGLQTLLELHAPSTGRGANWGAILVSNLMFASAHTHLDFRFAVAAFVPGLFWGWLFARHRSLVALGVSHAILGVFALFVVGIQPIIGGR